MSGKKALMASAGLRDDDGCIHATSRKTLKTRCLQNQTSSMHSIPSRRSNGVVLRGEGVPRHNEGEVIVACSRSIPPLPARGRKCHETTYRSERSDPAADPGLR